MNIDTRLLTHHSTYAFHVYHDNNLILNYTSSGSQFFICTVDTPWLDGKHCVFGKVTDGLDVVDKMEEMGSSSGKTATRIVIKDCGEL